METKTRHISSPHSGWYLCGHRPLHKTGVRVSHQPSNPNAPTCKTCQRIANKHRVTGRYEPELELLLSMERKREQWRVEKQVR